MCGTDAYIGVPLVPSPITSKNKLIGEVGKVQKSMSKVQTGKKRN